MSGMIGQGLMRSLVGAFSAAGRAGARFKAWPLEEKVAGIVVTAFWGGVGAWAGVGVIRACSPPTVPAGPMFHGTNADFWPSGLPKVGEHFKVNRGAFFVVNEEKKSIAYGFATGTLQSMHRSDGVSFGTTPMTGTPVVLIVEPVDQKPCMKKSVVLGDEYFVPNTELKVIGRIEGPDLSKEVYTRSVSIA